MWKVFRVYFPTKLSVLLELVNIRTAYDLGHSNYRSWSFEFMFFWRMDVDSDVLALFSYIDRHSPNDCSYFLGYTDRKSENFTVRYNCYFINTRTTFKISATNTTMHCTRTTMHCTIEGTWRNKGSWFVRRTYSYKIHEVGRIVELW